MRFLKTEWRRLKGRFIYSWAGLKTAWQEEHSFRFWTVIKTVSSVTALALSLDPTYKMMIISLGFLVLASECMNTAIERVVNHLSPDPHPLAKAAKDTGSAAVAVTALSAGVAWIFAIVSLF